MLHTLIAIGNYIKVENKDVAMIYAHCRALYVDEGSIVTLGQEIAEVGMTGNATGPHLHFEIIKEDRKIDPMYIFDF